MVSISQSLDLDFDLTFFNFFASRWIIRIALFPYKKKMFTFQFKHSKDLGANQNEIKNISYFSICS